MKKMLLLFLSSMSFCIHTNLPVENLRRLFHEGPLTPIICQKPEPLEKIVLEKLPKPLSTIPNIPVEYPLRALMHNGFSYDEINNTPFQSHNISFSLSPSSPCGSHNLIHAQDLTPEEKRTARKYINEQIEITHESFNVCGRCSKYVCYGPYVIYLYYWNSLLKKFNYNN